jgi:hypothetical protein
MSAAAFESLLARIYVDAQARARFLADPYSEAAKAGLTEEECAALEQIDRVGLELAAGSFERKRAGRCGDRRNAGMSRSKGWIRLRLSDWRSWYGEFLSP